jgi:hypothetical protein
VNEKNNSGKGLNLVLLDYIGDSNQYINFFPLTIIYEQIILTINHCAGIVKKKI